MPVGPGFVGRKRNDGPYDADKGFEDQVNRRLGGTPERVIGVKGVQTVLDHVMVGRGQNSGAKPVDDLNRSMQFKAIEGMSNFFPHLIGAGKSP